MLLLSTDKLWANSNPIHQHAADGMSLPVQGKFGRMTCSVCQEMLDQGFCLFSPKVYLATQRWWTGADRYTAGAITLEISLNCITIPGRKRKCASMKANPQPQRPCRGSPCRQRSPRTSQHRCKTHASYSMRCEAQQVWELRAKCTNVLQSVSKIRFTMTWIHEYCLFLVFSSSQNDHINVTKVILQSNIQDTYHIDYVQVNWEY